MKTADCVRMGLWAVTMIQQNKAFELRGSSIEMAGKDLILLNNCSTSIDKALKALQCAVSKFSRENFEVQPWVWRRQVYAVICPLDAAQLDLFGDQVKALADRIARSLEYLDAIADAVYPTLTEKHRTSIRASQDIDKGNVVVVRGSEVLVRDQAIIDDATAVSSFAAARGMDEESSRKIRALVERRNFSQSSDGEKHYGRLTAIDIVRKLAVIDVNRQRVEFRMSDSDDIEGLMKLLSQNVSATLRKFKSTGILGSDAAVRYELVNFTGGSLVK